MVTLLLAVLVVGLVLGVRATRGSSLSPLRTQILSVALSQVGYRTDPPNTYCNRFSAYWHAGTDDCGNTNLSEEWCADFAAWVWKQAGAEVAYEPAPGYLNSNSASFYVWGVDHGTWHPVGSHYVPQPGDVAVYGLNVAAVTAQHVGIVTGVTVHGAPDVINGDGDRSGFSVVESADDELYADVEGHGGPLSGYVSPSEPSAAPNA